MSRLSVGMTLTFRDYNLQGFQPLEKSLKPGKWKKPFPDLEKSWNLGKAPKPGKIMELFGNCTLEKRKYFWKNQGKIMEFDSEIWLETLIYEIKSLCYTPSAHPSFSMTSQAFRDLLVWHGDSCDTPSYKQKDAVPACLVCNCTSWCSFITVNALQVLNDLSWAKGVNLFKVCLNRYSWGAGKAGSEYSSWFIRLECIKKTEGRVTSPNNEDVLCKFVCKSDKKWRQEIARR